MGVRIEACAGYRLALTGNVETVLFVPQRGRREGFTLAFSDGTLLRGTCASGGDACRFEHVTEGLARVEIARLGSGDMVELDYEFDWITLACGTDALRPEAINDDTDASRFVYDIGSSEAA